MSERVSATQQQLKSFETKLQAFCAGLPEDEQPILASILRRAADNPEVVGYDGLPIMTLGSGHTLSLSGGGAKGTDPNAGKDGATVAGQPGGTTSGKVTAFGFSFSF